MSLYPVVAPFARSPEAPPLPPLLHNTTPLEAAVRAGTLGTGYASGGFLVFYYIGVSKVLQQLGIVRPGITKSAGTSIGSIVQGLDQGIGNHDDFITDHAPRFCAKCRANRMCFQTLDHEFTDLVREIVSENKDVAKRISGKGCLVVSRGSTANPVGEGHCHYESDEQVVQAVRASSYIPGWSGINATVDFEGRPAFDGAFSQYVPCPPGSTFCIRVSGFPPVATASLIGGLLAGRDAASVPLWLSAAAGILGPQPLETLRNGFATNTPTTIDLPAWFRVFATIQTPGVFDIYPGRFGSCPLTTLQLAAYMLTPPTNDIIQLLYKMGQDDGHAWAKTQGWTEERKWPKPLFRQAAEGRRRRRR